MKKLFFTANLLVAGFLSSHAQNYITRTGQVSFDATSKSSPEKVEAKNNEVACIVDAGSGNVRFQVLVKSFKFERELMQEHFNENYMESDKYPKSEFSGNITNLGDVNFAKDGAYNAKVSGKLTIHGVTNDVAVPGIITVKGNTITLKATFKVVMKDVNITVPSVVADKVDKVATITVDSELTRK